MKGEMIVELLTINEITKTITNPQRVSEVYDEFLVKLRESEKTVGQNLVALVQSPFELRESEAQLEEMDFTQYEDLHELGVVKHLRIPLRTDSDEEGYIIYSFNDHHYSIQISMSVTHKKDELLNQLRNHKNFEKLVQKIRAENYVLEFDDVQVLNHQKFLSDANNVSEYNVLSANIKDTETNESVGFLHFNTQEGEPYLYLGDEQFGVVDDDVVQINASSCLVSWMNCMLMCLCGATSGSCAIAISGCIGACCGCTGWISCIPCLGCAAGVAACGNQCTSGSK